LKTNKLKGLIVHGVGESTSEKQQQEDIFERMDGIHADSQGLTTQGFEKRG